MKNKYYEVEPLMCNFQRTEENDPRPAFYIWGKCSFQGSEILYKNVLIKNKLCLSN